MAWCASWNWTLTSCTSWTASRTVLDIELRCSTNCSRLPYIDPSIGTRKTKLQTDTGKTTRWTTNTTWTLIQVISRRTASTLITTGSITSLTVGTTWRTYLIYLELSTGLDQVISIRTSNTVCIVIASQVRNTVDSIKRVSQNTRKTGIGIIRFTSSTRSKTLNLTLEVLI